MHLLRPLRAFVICLTLSLLAPALATRAAGVVETPADFFPIAVWSQPIYSFDKWKSRGINTLLRYEGYGGAPGNDIDSWSNAATAKGFYQVRQPRTNPADDLAEPRLLAWLQDDEPDIHNTDPAVVIQRYAQLKAADPFKPVMVNFSGGNVLNGATPRVRYEQYMQGADWGSNDLYPVTGWGQPAWIDLSQPSNNRKTAAQALQQLHAWSGKPQWAILETGHQNLSWISNGRSVTRDEFRGQVWQSILYGARGIAYFPFTFNSFRFDATPEPVAEEMTIQNARIQSVARILNSDPTPEDARLSVGNSLLEAARRTYDGDEYFFVLNMSSRTLSDVLVTLPGLAGLPEMKVHGEDRTLGLSAGRLTDDFGPWELHIYHADLSGWGLLPAEGSGSSVPEPGSALALATLAAGAMLRRRRRQRRTGRPS